MEQDLGRLVDLLAGGFGHVGPVGFVRPASHPEQEHGCALDDLDSCRPEGEELGTSDWLKIDQDRVNAFAAATGDHQWIHVDVERAAAGPFGGTIAHGYLTLSLIPYLGSQVFSLETPGASSTTA